MTRADLPPGVQAVQAVHAAIEITSHYHAHGFPEHLPDTVALLAARDELELCWLAESARRDGIVHILFREPDLGDQLTAVAIESAGAKLCRKYPLALEDK